MAHYWLKLPLDLIQNPAFMRLSENLKWSYVSLLIMAKGQGDTGELPDVDDMAWELRKDPVVLENEISQLANKGLAEWLLEKDCWYLPGFEEMQGNTSAAERMRKYRERKKREAAENGDLPILEELKEEIRRSELDIDIDRSVTVVTKRNEQVTDYSKDELADFILEIEEFWFSITGGGRPADRDTYAADYFKPANELLIRCQWDTQRAKELLEEQRGDMLRKGMKPYKLKAVVPGVIADLDIEKLQTAVQDEDRHLLEAIGAI